jgi:hypothetical protein
LVGAIAVGIVAVRNGSRGRRAVSKVRTDPFP